MSGVISTQSLGLRLRRTAGRPCAICGEPQSTCGPDHMRYPPVEAPSEKRARARRVGADEKTRTAPNKRINPPAPTEIGKQPEAQPAQPEREGRGRSQRRRRAGGK